MKKERRWIKSVVAESARMKLEMPWARGERRRPATGQAPRQRPASAAAR